jgi:hypothetical protein
MKLVMVKDTSAIKDVAFDRVPLVIPENTELIPGLNRISVRLPVEPIHGDKLRFIFRGSRELAFRDIVMMYGDVEPEGSPMVTMLFYNMDQKIMLEAGTKIAEAVPYEPVMLRKDLSAPAPRPEPKTPVSPAIKRRARRKA